MKAKTKRVMKIGAAMAMVGAVSMYFKKNPEAFEKVKGMMGKMMKNNSQMDLDSFYEEM